MKRVFFKQAAALVLFACSLSADVPGLRNRDDPATVGRDRIRCSGVDVTVNWPTHGAFACCDDRDLGIALRTRLPLDDMAWMLAAVPIVGRGFYGVPVEWLAQSPRQGSWNLDFLRGRDRANQGFSQSMDALQTALLQNYAFVMPRYLVPLAVQDSVYPGTAGEQIALITTEDPTRLSETDEGSMIPRLKKVFMKEGVPQQWVWVAEVESALNPRAKSSAGAVGLFQLMPATARRFGLQTTPVDDRMEPEKSAGAAAQYLKFLRREFGCWSLALAAYNAGEGRIKEIMKKRKARTFEEVARYLPSETRAYVPKVMAIVALREDQLHGVPGAYWMP
ncbi:MAG: lytic transglycosylase domain-containing protein [Kiritimatiellae bacterium]|nr:lytic transglycosylase domain-containing protein [Kiritimatiellia bacterium]